MGVGGKRGRALPQFEWVGVVAQRERVFTVAVHPALMRCAVKINSEHPTTITEKHTHAHGRTHARVGH
jgi:hypothetical protein